MKENIIDTIARGMIFGALAWFGLRGVLPDIVAAGNLPALLSAGAVAIAGYAIGSFVYRCTYRCEATCDPKFCRAM